MTESYIVTDLADLSGVQITVRIRVGWRARIARWLLYLAQFVGGNELEFVGGEHGGSNG